MRLFYALLLLSVSHQLLAQQKTVTIPLSAKGDTSLYYKWQHEVAQKLSLPSLLTSKHPFYFRFWSHRQITDIWQSTQGEIGGQLITWTDEFVGNHEEPTYRTHMSKKSLQADTARVVKNLIDESGILKLPSDDSIAGWKQGFDGMTYIVEISTPTMYSLKTYWTPTVQGNLKEAVQVETFAKNIRNQSGADLAWQGFAPTIPFECYYNGGIGVVCKIFSKKEQRKLLKERNRYRRSIATNL